MVFISPSGKLIMSAPFFSILVPCYNQAHYLEHLVSTVRSQSFTAWELLIINDGSTDETLSVSTSLSARDTRVRIYTKENGGLSAARNSGLKYATGTFVQFLDADDFLLPDTLQRVFDFVGSDNSIDIIQVGYHYVNENNSRVLHTVLPPKRNSMLPYVLVNNLGPCHSFFVRRELIDKIGSFDETLKSAEDWDFWMRAAKIGVRFAVLRECLVAYRYVPSSMSRDAFRMYNALKTVSLRATEGDVFNKAISEREINEGIKRHLLTCLGVSVMQGKIDESVNLFISETRNLSIQVTVVDFGYMYSYLSFRYWNTDKELDRVVHEFYPRYKTFFKRIGLTAKEVDSALREVFKSTLKFRNHLRFGKALGGIMNRFLYPA
jgi:glycosyltransferase involved in cell wall biosynthesis